MATNATLKLTGNVRVLRTPEDVHHELASLIIALATQATVERGWFHLALSGGSTPAPFYTSLSIDPRYRVIPWEQTHIWIVDERRVPEDDDRYNFKMIRQTLTDHVPTPPSQVHRVNTSLDDPAAEYEQQLTEVFGCDAGAISPPRLDLILLGMGDDAHTASLFPGSPALTADDRLVVNNDGPNVTPPPRVTMTYPLINAARQVGVLAIGAKKRPTLERVDAQLRTHGPDIQVMPITGINPGAHGGGVLTWWLDAAAAGVSQ